MNRAFVGGFSFSLILSHLLSVTAHSSSKKTVLLLLLGVGFNVMQYSSQFMSSTSSLNSSPRLIPVLASSTAMALSRGSMIEFTSLLISSMLRSLRSGSSNPFL